MNKLILLLTIVLLLPAIACQSTPERVAHEAVPTGTVVRLGAALPPITLTKGLDPEIAGLSATAPVGSIIEFTDAPAPELLKRLLEIRIGTENLISRGVYYVAAEKSSLARLARFPEVKGITRVPPRSKYSGESEANFAGRLYIRMARPVSAEMPALLETHGFHVVSFDQATATYIVEGPLEKSSALFDRPEIMAVSFWRRPTAR